MGLATQAGAYIGGLLAKAGSKPAKYSGPDKSMSGAAIEERYARYRRLFAIKGHTMGTAISRGWIDSTDWRLTKAGREWVIMTIGSGEKEHEVNWGNIIVEAGHELADGAAAATHVLGEVAGSGIGAAAGGAAGGAASGGLRSFLKNPVGVGVAGLVAYLLLKR